MIKHVVMWKFKDFAEGKTKEENLNYVKSMLEELPSKIDFLHSMKVSLNVNPKEGMFDAVLESEFDTLEDVKNYRVHPEHVKISSYVALVKTDRASVDYEF